MYTFDEDTVSDLHKDAYGFRPSQSWWYGWTHATDASKQLHWDLMVGDMARSESNRIEEEKRAIVEFESRVKTVIETGAGDRETAIRWLAEAGNSAGDLEHFAWQNGLPYQYFKKV